MSTRYDMIIDQGSDFNVEIELFDDNGDPDLSNYTANGMFRKNYTSSNAYSFVCNIDSGVLTLSLSAGSSANVVPGRYVYDVELYNVDANTTSRILEGQVTVTPQITH